MNQRASSKLLEHLLNSELFSKLCFIEVWSTPNIVVVWSAFAANIRLPGRAQNNEWRHLVSLNKDRRFILRGRTTKYFPTAQKNKPDPLKQTSPARPSSGIRRNAVNADTLQPLFIQ